jgi:hypothetical protein
LFGYIRPLISELKVRELELYRSVYCGLCRAMKHSTGNLSRISISYDFVFCAFIRAALTGQSFNPEKRWCFLHPFEKRLIAAENEPLVDCALMSAVLTREKAYDNYHDSRFLSKISTGMALPQVNRMLKLAIRKDPEVADVAKCVREKMDKLYELERSGCKSPDEPAQASGELLAEIFKYRLEGEKRSIASAVGIRVGRWVYLVDAADDYQSDLKNDQYNPFIEAETQPDERLFEALRLELSDARKAMDLVDISDPDIKAIIYNILSDGMTTPIEARLSKKFNGINNRNIEENFIHNESIEGAAPGSAKEEKKDDKDK